MLPKALPASLAIFFATITLHAQLPFSPLPNGVVGVPYSTDLGDGLGNVPQIPGFQVSYSYSLANGTLPPGLALNASGLLGGIPTSAGTFTFGVNFAFNSSLQGQTVNFTLPLRLSMEVSGSAGSPVIAVPGGLIYALTQSSPSAVQAISVINRSAQSSGFTTSIGSGASQWLSANPTSSSVPAFASTGVMVKADATGLPAGTYTGVVTVNVPSTGEKFDTRVIATNASSQPFVQLSQTGLRFQSVSGGGSPLSQSITVVDPGPSPVNYSVSTSTLSGGKWLSVSPATGSSTFLTPSAIQVNVDPTNLTPGDYYGQVLFVPLGASGLVGTSINAVVVLNVFGPDKSPGASVQPAGLLFAGRASSGNPAAATILVANPSPTPLNFSAVTFLDPPGNWITVSPLMSAVTTASPLAISVRPNLAGLAPGTYRGEINLRFAEDGSVRRIAVLLIVTPASTAAISDSSTPSVAIGCTPSKLVGVPTALPSGFRTAAGFPASIEVNIADDCGTPVTSGTVSASFSSGDPQLSLLSLLDGRWSATWQPRTSAAQVTVSVLARQSLPALTGSFSFGGIVQPNSTTPAILPGGVVSAASYAGQQPLAPGSYVAIFGSRLSPGVNQSPNLPLSLQLGGTQAMLGNKTLPLQFTSDGQINAIVPFDIPINTSQSLIVQNGVTLSSPERVAIAPAQPAVFTKDLSGKGAGIVTGFKPNGQPINSGQVLDAANPATAGDTLVIYCAGLGAVDPPVPAGQAAPLSPLSKTVNTVRVTIGGQEATVGFAGLAPTFAGLYQINAIVPAGVTPGNADLIVTVAGLSSASVTVPVR